MSDQTPDQTNDDRLAEIRRSLHGSAERLDLQPVEPAVVHRRATRRRRRRMALAGGTTALAVVAVGAVVANQDRGDDTLELSTPTETTEATPTDGGGDGDDGATTASPTPATTPITTPPTLPPVETDSSVGSGFETADVAASGLSGDFSHLLAWRDGFLRIGFEYEPQPLPEISEEIAALFPPEVNELFPDGLPPTIDEAIEVLSEADLLDEVTAVLSEHPEANDAIYAEPPPPPTLRADFTTDGVEWSSVDLTSPLQFPGQFSVSGNRLVTWSTDPVEPFDETRPDGPRELVVAWTDDLTTWQTSRFALETPPESPAYVQHESFVSSLAVAGDRWLAQVQQHAWVNFETLLPDDVRADLNVGDGYGLGTNDDGITLELFDENGRGEEQQFTWAELGLDGDPNIDQWNEPAAPTLLLGDLSGGVEELTAPEGQRWGNVFSSGDEFFFVGESAMSSVDGRTWTPIEGVGDHHISTVVTLRDATMFLGEDEDGPIGWLRNPAGALTEVDLPDLPRRYGLWNQNGSPAWIVELYEESDGVEWEPVTIDVEHEGFRLSLTDGPDGSSYTLTDAATGDVVAEANAGLEDGPPQNWEYDEETETATFVVTDAEGNEIVRIPGELVNAAYDDYYSEFDVGPDVPAEEWAPDFWLIATSDGVNWLVRDLADPTPEMGFWPQTAAINNGSVLYQTAEGWVLEPLPTGS